MHLVVIISIGWIIQGASEELVTRGWMMNVPEKRYNTTFAVILSLSLFALLHLENPNIDLISIINIILVGLVFSLYVI
ncbi:CPBP family intramembrane metalloprotease [Romboutsia weinsteinii]|uniref:CPBP family intramembrane metalloprotease n=1 Tax=Romboutsia weinsteinii TaxID=2020949 RepID=A0A371J141_9FIRM|nr:CPBP family intramembrane metalloprotease [Romboutsia weinsteinii]